MVGFAKSSHILVPTIISHKQKRVKTVCIHPFAHEFERAMAGFVKICGCTPEIRAYGAGLTISTRSQDIDDSTKSMDGIFTCTRVPIS